MKEMGSAGTATQPGPLILCAADLVQAAVGSLALDEYTQPETDCACADERSRSALSKLAGWYPPETDCACADACAPALPVCNLEETVPYWTPALHVDELPGGYRLAFNPLSDAGVVVFDQAAWTILQQFRQPRQINSVTAGDERTGMAVRRLVALHMLQPVGAPSAAEHAPATTLTVWLHVTNECNLRCDYCFVSKTPDEMDMARGRRAIDAVIRSALRHGFPRIKIKYAGGEATLNIPLILAVHRYARECAVQHGLTLDGVVLSNGVALGERTIRSLRDSGIRLMISLDGIGDLHDANRRFANGRGSFTHVARTLDRLARHGIKPSISITLSRRNLGGLAATVAYVLERGLPFAINFYRENECSAGFTDLAYQDDQMIAAMQEAFAVIARRLPPYSLLGALLDRARLDAPHDYPCGVGRSYMVIDQRGGVAKCHMEIDRTVTDVTATDPLQLIREDTIGIQNIPVAEKEGCRECTWRSWCAGGCPALTYRVTGRYDVKSPNCRIYQALFPDVVRLEGLRLLKYGGLA
ncbi:radical SAM protein [Roseiflexus sp.]|uniref:radical SAM protein n=1 Tax=Roseiflexus sp. TaxID=2562120 RepID=UPI00398B83EC